MAQERCLEGRAPRTSHVQPSNRHPSETNLRVERATYVAVLLVASGERQLEAFYAASSVRISNPRNEHLGVSGEDVPIELAGINLKLLDELLAAILPTQGYAHDPTRCAHQRAVDDGIYRTQARFTAKREERRAVSKAHPVRIALIERPRQSGLPISGEIHVQTDSATVLLHLDVSLIWDAACILIT